METRITKIQKGEFYIEYKVGRWSIWRTFEKKFKTKAKAEDWLATHKID